MEVNTLAQARDFLQKHPVVLFDLDDTLYSEKDYVKSGFCEIADHFKNIPRMEEMLWQAFQRGEKAINAVLHQVGEYSEEKVAYCLSLYRNHIPKIRIYPEAEALLRNLLEKGARLGLLTDGRPEGQRAKIKALCVERYFEKIIISDELGGTEYRKPHPKAFEEMQRYFQVPWQEMVYVGDNPRKDFIAPKRLGMDFVYFRNPCGLYGDC